MSRFLAMILGLAGAAPSAAQVILSDLSCDDSARMTQKLEQVLGATRQGIGLRDPETMVEVWATAGNGEWLIVQTYANGTSCIVAMGEHWQGRARSPA
ncbi:MAG: hypothetical protein AAFY38_13235 [Pseudomonadota bacterium]